MKEKLSKNHIVLLFFLFSTISLLAQERTIKGKVIDNKGLDIPGISIIIKGTTKGTITDLNGNYVLEGVSSTDLLVFSGIGYKPKETRVGDNKIIDITLLESTKDLDEVVVIGYSQMKKRDLTGSVSSIQSKDIVELPVSSAAEAITGKLAGVRVTTTEGAPGADTKITIRGGGSITQNNSPLYIVDGFPSDLGLNGVDPNDIQSIDILKDASSTSIYGSRGSNGVVIITTKSGKEGFNINYNGYTGFRKIAKTLPVQNSLDFVKSQWERKIRSGGTNPYMGDIIDIYGNWSEFENLYKNKSSINWQDELFSRTAMLQSHNLVVSGGTKSTKYNFNYTRNDEQGIMVHSGFNRSIYKFKFDQRVNNRFSYYASTSYLESKTLGGGTTEAKDVYSSLINILQYRPITGKDLSNDILLSDPGDSNSDDSYNYNPVLMESSLKKTKYQSNLQLNAGMNFNISRALTLKISGGMYTADSKTSTVYGNYTYYALTAGGTSAVIDDRLTRKWNMSNVLTYTKKDKLNNLVLMLGQEANRMDYTQNVLTGNKFPNEDIVLGNMGQAQVQAINTNEYAESLLSFFGRANYSYKSKYLFSTSLRIDGSSKFDSNNKYAYFPAMSGAWRISEEKFFEPLKKHITDIKLRYSFGTSGNNRIDNYLFSTTYTPVYYGLNNESTLGLKPTSLANPNLKWETTITNNLGIDLSLFNNRVSLTTEAYINKTNDLLLNASISSVSGYTTQMLNIGKTQNKGVEFTVNTHIIKNEKFSWDAGFNISFNRNKILALNRDGNWNQEYYVETSKWGYMSGDYLVKVGQPLGLMYGYVEDGIYTANDFKDVAFTTGVFSPANLKDDVPYATTQAKETNLLGQVKVKRFSNAVDENGHPIASVDQDKVVIGNANPDFFGGFNTNFTYKGFDCSIFLNFVVGNDVYNATKLRGSTQMYRNQNVLDFGEQRYTMVDPLTGGIVLDRDRLNELNANATMSAIPQIATTLTNWVIEDGSFLRINNISIGYTIPAQITEKIKVKLLRIYVTGYNLYNFTKYTGYDPEVDSRYSTPTTPGLDYAAYPRSRQFIMGLNLTF